MNKSFYIFLLLVLPFAVFAQSGIKIGVNAGTTFSNIRGSEGADVYKYDFDYLAGLSVEVPINTKFSFVANVNYERKSFKDKFKDYFSPNFDPVLGIDNYPSVKEKATLQYISVPVNIKYYIGTKNRFFVNAGAFLGFFIDDIDKIDGHKVDEYAGSSDFKSVDFGVNLGIGTRIPINAKNDLNIELRDNLGLVNISDMPFDGIDNIKTNSINLIVNWQFKL